MTDPKRELLKTFQNQVEFSREYSPLYTSFFAAVAAWLDGPAQDPVAAAIWEVAELRRPLDSSLLFAAALHRDVLTGHSALSQLAHYYPSAGGRRTPGYAQQNDWHIDPDFQDALYQAILDRRDHIQEFIRANQVQTNETGRGIAWLFPIWLARWPRINLLDLGASAGLNLVADRRSYRLITGSNGKTIYEVGNGRPGQFEVRSPDELQLSAYQMPRIVGRLGCDINPFHLRTPQDEATLTAFIWADQLTRIQRLQEGIAALRQVNRGSAPVQLHAVELPAGLPQFLEQIDRREPDPLICYNTYIRMYLPRKGSDLRRHIVAWAAEQNRPIVWIQWEPPSRLNGRHGKAPQYGWLAWTIDMWFRGRHQHWHIAWVHPHGHHVHWLPDLYDWINNAQKVSFLLLIVSDIDRGDRLKGKASTKYQSAYLQGQLLGK